MGTPPTSTEVIHVFTRNLDIRDGRLLETRVLIGREVQRSSWELVQTYVHSDWTRSSSSPIRMSRPIC